MDRVIISLAEYHKVENLFRAGNVTDALSLTTQLVQNNPTNRQHQLYHLLTQITAFGPERHEAEIESLRALTALTENERAIITQILRRCLEAAVQKGDEGTARAYQRSLRRWAAGLSLDRPFSPLRVQKVGQNARSTRLTDIELATLRNVFTAEPGEQRRGITGRMLRLRAALSNKPAAISALRVEVVGYLERIAIIAKALRRDIRQKCGAAARASRLNLVMPQNLRHLRLSTSAVWFVLIGFVSGMAVTVTGMKFGNLQSQNPRIETVRQPAPTVQRPSLNILGSAPALSSSPPLQVASDDDIPTKNNLGTNLRRAGARGREQERQVRDPADPQKGRARKPAAANQGRPVFKVMQTIGLRNEPRFSAPKGSPLEHSARLVVMGGNGSWLKVRNEATGATGYVRKEFLAQATPDS